MAILDGDRFMLMYQPRDMIYEDVWQTRYLHSVLETALQKENSGMRFWWVAVSSAQFFLILILHVTMKF